MKTIDWKYTSVGQIVADDFAAASVFKKAEFNLQMQQNSD